MKKKEWQKKKQRKKTAEPAAAAGKTAAPKDRRQERKSAAGKKGRRGLFARDPLQRRPGRAERAGREVRLLGTVSKNRKGFGFVTPGEGGEDIFIRRDHLNGAMDGDEVSVELLPGGRGDGKREGRVREILSRAVSEVVGTFEKGRRIGYVIPDSRKHSEEIFVPAKSFRGAKSGDKVVVKITKYPRGLEPAEGSVSEIVARRDEKGADLKALIRAYGLSEDFPPRVLAEAEDAAEAPDRVIGEELKRRKDLRDKPAVTIDGAFSKDLDDAVCLETLPGGIRRLGVHIADVSHYVREGRKLDKEAFLRGTSVYPADRVVPMLPPVISNGICSLNPGEDRLALSAEIDYTAEGEVAAYRIFPSVIRSKARMVYDEVSDLLEKEDPAAARLAPFSGMLSEMKQLAETLRARRMARGSLDFEFDEAEILTDENGFPVSVEPAERRIANRMIEEFMLAANEVVAEHFFRRKIPFVYRVHQRPDEEKIRELREFISGFGLALKGNPEKIRPGEIAEMLEGARGKPFENLVSTVTLRAMKKAFYSDSCEGHFGLAMKYYCHFTSPIRRYPDLLIHRIIKETLSGPPGKLRERVLRKRAAEAAEASSAAERTSQELEREAEKLKKAEFMAGRIGERWEGVISGVAGSGFFVQLPNTIEGMVRVSRLENDYYQLESERYRLRGVATGKVYALGDPVAVRVEEVSLADREIDFSLAEESLPR